MFNMFHQKWLRSNVWALLQTSLDQKGYIMFLLSNVQYNCIRCYMFLPMPQEAFSYWAMQTYIPMYAWIPWGYLENFMKEVCMKRVDPMELSWECYNGSMAETLESHEVILNPMGLIRLKFWTGNKNYLKKLLNSDAIHSIKWP